MGPVFPLATICIMLGSSPPDSLPSMLLLDTVLTRRRCVRPGPGVARTALAHTYKLSLLAPTASPLQAKKPRAGSASLKHVPEPTYLPVKFHLFMID